MAESTVPRSHKALGEFLRAHRAKVEPEQVGFSASTGRRVAGLRRSEVAVLANVSADYYTRLEQGRERNPSARVLDAIARALRLNPEAHAHAYRLAGLDPTPPTSNAHAEVSHALLQLLYAVPEVAAYVLSPGFDVLAANPAAAGLLSPFRGMRNMVRILLTHPAARTVFVDWRTMTERTVHSLRLNAGCFPHDPQIHDLVNELLQSSPYFRSIWHDQTVDRLSYRVKVFEYPEVGRIELTYQTFDVRAAPGCQLLVGTPEPDSPSAKALVRLARDHRSAAWPEPTFRIPQPVG